MATGDADDLLARLKNLVPGGWFAFAAPVRDAVLGGLATGLAGAYDLLAAVKAQTRLATTSGWLLDLAAYDFLGSRVLRRAGELDDSWRKRIVSEVLRERVTIRGISQALFDLTGKRPIIVEPFDPAATAAYGYDYYGHCTYGSLALQTQIFVTAYRPSPVGIANIAGYGFGFYGAPTTAYVDLTQSTGAVPDDEIYATVADTKAAGIIAWTSIQ